MDKRRFDIIIPVYHPDGRFAELLSMLKKQTLKPERIILMETLDDGETLTEYEGCEAYPVRKRDFDHAATRRAGISLSGSEAFILMTDDAVPADEKLTENLMAALYSENAGGKRNALCYARQLPSDLASDSESFARYFNYPAESSVKTADDLPRLGIKTYFASNVCCAYDRGIYEDNGGFTDHAIFNEDMIYCCLALKNGYSAAYSAEAAVIHSHRYTVKEQLKRNFDIGVSQKMHPEVFGGIKSEGEGMRLVVETAKYLLKKGRWYMIPKLIIDSGAKYLGYRLGKRYDKLSAKTIGRLSLNRSFADKYLI